VELGAEPATSCAERGALPRTPINIGDIALDEPRRPARRKLFQVLGPGLITGASDDDPSGIATYSQVGAQFGYGLAWTLVFSYPLMAAIQEISARSGRVTGFGIAGNLRRHYPAWLSGSIVLLLLSANLINLGADLGAMGAALKLLIEHDQGFADRIHDGLFEGATLRGAGHRISLRCTVSTLAVALPLDLAAELGISPSRGILGQRPPHTL
jgi:hypothetical protein